MKKLILLFSLILEANSLLNHSKIKFNKLNKSHYFYKDKNHEINVYIIGMGKKLEKHIKNLNFNKKDLIIKAGTCAVIDNDFHTGEIIIPEILSKNNNDLNLSLENIPLELNENIKKFIVNKKLITLDKPLYNEEKKNQLFQSGFSFVDMECFSIIDHFKDNTVIPLLVCTDNGDSKAVNDFYKNISNASNLLKNEIIKILSLI